MHFMYSRGVARGGQGASAPLRKKDRIFFKRPIKNLALIEGTMLVDYGHSTGFGVCLCSLRLAANH